jgi:hypothetical protein
MNEQAAIQKLVTNFVTDLHSLFQRSAIAALTGAGHGNGKLKLSLSNGMRGNKRAPEDLERVSEAFVAYVSKHPGLRIEQINKELGTTTKDLALPIRKLIAGKRVKARGAKRSTTYFPGKE